MKKVVNLFTLLAFLGASFFALFSYAQMESPEVMEISENVVENTGESEIIPENNIENPESEVPAEPENIEEQVVQNDETPEQDSQLQMVQEPVIMGLEQGTTATLLPGQEFNSVIKTLANGGVEVAYTGVDNNIQSFERVDTVPSGVTTGEISEAGEQYPVYAWFEEGTLYYATKAETIQLNPDSQNMFQNLNGLTELDLSDFDTSVVTSMFGIFAGCNQLGELNLSGWDFRNINTASFVGMLFGNSSSSYVTRLRKLNLTNTKFSGSVERAFYYMNNLESLILDGVDTSNVTNMDYMFYECGKLTELNVVSFDTSNVTSMNFMFEGCRGLERLDVSSFDTSNVTGMYEMFKYYNGTSLDLSNFDTSKVINMKGMFAGCWNLEELNLSGWDFRKQGDFRMYNLGFYGSDRLKKLNLTNAMFSGSMSDAFLNMYNLETIKLNGTDTSNVTYMRGVFQGCSKLTGLDLSSFDTSKVTDFYYMVGGCDRLEKINLSGWDFRKNRPSNGPLYNAPSLREVDMTNVKFSGSMSHLFFLKSNLENIIGLETWDTNNVTDMGLMFYGCSKLTGLDLSNWDTSSVTNMNNMFSSCDNLTYLNMSGWNFSSMNSMKNWINTLNLWSPLEKLDLTNAKFSGDLSYMFDSSKSKEIMLDGVNTLNASNMNNMFNGCDNLTELDLSSFDTSNVTNMGCMFSGCSKLENLNLDNRVISGSSSTIGGMFGGANNLKTVSMRNWTIPEIFQNAIGCRTSSLCATGLESIDVSNWNLSGIKNLNGVFGTLYAKEIKGLDTWNTSNVTNMEHMFEGCSNLTGLDLSNFDTSNVTNMGNMFNGCINLIGLDLSNFDTSNVTSMSSIFAGSPNLEYLNLSGWDFTHLSNRFGMGTLAGGQTLLKYLNLSNAKFTGDISYGFNYVKIGEVNLNGADVSNVTNMTSLFAGNDTLTKIGLEGWDTSNVGYMGYMFLNCKGLTGLDLSSFDTRKVQNMGGMFENATNLKTIYASDKFVVNVPEETRLSSMYMFNNDINLVGGNGTKFDSGYTDKTYAKIDKVGQTGYFTDRNAITVKFINTLDGSETTSTFKKGQKLTPPSVNGYHAVGGYLDEAMTQQIDLNNGVDVYTEVYVKYERNGSSGGGGGGWGGGGGSSSSSSSTGSNTSNVTPSQLTGTEANSSTGTQNDQTTTGTIVDEPEGTGNNAEIQTGNVVEPLEQTSLEDDNSQVDSPVEVSEGQNNSQGTQTYSTEFQEAYKFAHDNGITTKDTIQSAQMDSKLTRIAMAKMLSQYAVNVLGKELDLSKGTVSFNDVTNKMNKDYDNGVTLAYQLGIMGQNMPGNNFRPNDEVSRAEFATALSRLLYSTSDGEYESTSKYYEPHMQKLKEEGIITNTDPKMKELRGYVMIMLMRSAKN